MEMKDLLLADCLVHTGFGGRACLKQSCELQAVLVTLLYVFVKQYFGVCLDP